MQDNLQGLVEWFDMNREASKEEILDVLKINFGLGSPLFNISQLLLLVVCGKRAECIQARRERILATIPNRNVQMALSKIPPSAEHLFGKGALSTLVQSLGGAQSWLNKPSFVNQKRFVTKRENFFSGNSRFIQPPVRAEQHTKNYASSRRNNSNSNSSSSKQKSSSTKPNSSSTANSFRGNKLQK